MNEERFDWKLERAVRDGVPFAPAESEKARAALAESNRQILSEYPVEQMTRKIRRRLDTLQRRRRWAFIGGIGLIAATACTVVLLLRVPPARVVGDSDESILLKGGGASHCGTCGRSEPHLHLFIQKSGRSQLAQNGRTARAGDHVQLGYHALPGEGVIVSVDGRGGTTLHWPLTAEGSTQLAPGDHLLPQGFELDDAPDYERFFLVTGDHVSVQRVLEAARQLARSGDAAHASLPLPSGTSQSVFTVLKPEGTPPR